MFVYTTDWITCTRTHRHTHTHTCTPTQHTHTHTNTTHAHPHAHTQLLLLLAGFLLSSPAWSAAGARRGGGRQVCQLCLERSYEVFVLVELRSPCLL